MDEMIDDCKTVVFKLKIPDNEYLKQNEYDIKIREPDLSLKNCSTFTDVEWIITYYKPEISDNIILNSFFKSMVLLRDHLKNLIKIHNSQLLAQVLSSVEYDGGIELSDLNPEQVFEKCLSMNNIPIEQQQDLKKCFSQIIRDLDTHDVRAE